MEFQKMLRTSQITIKYSISNLEVVLFVYKYIANSLALLYLTLKHLEKYQQSINYAYSYSFFSFI